MKTILYVWRSMALLAGIERVICIKLNWLVSHGYKVVLVTYEQGSHPVIQPLHPDVTIIDLRTPFYSLSKYPLNSRLLKYIKMKNCFYKRLKEVVKEYRPDLVITIAGSMNVIKEIYRACHNSKLIIESHETFFSVMKETQYNSSLLLRNIAKLYDKRNLNIINHFDRMVCLTYGDASEWHKHVSTKIEVIPNPLDTFPILGDNSIKETHFRLISAGRIEDVKGYDRLINAFALIADYCPNWRLDIYGKGSREDFLRKLIAHFRLENRIAIFPPTNRIYTEYMNSDIYVLSSLHEGLGMVLLEAMSCGISCVAFNCDYGPREIIQDGVTGLLVEDGNVEKLAQAMIWMIEHPKERIEMGIKARESVAKYHINTIMPIWIKLFNEL